MTEAPEYWWQLTAGAAVMVILVGVLALMFLFYAILLLAQLRRSIADVTHRVQVISDRVDSVAKQVESVTTEVGARTAGIVRTVDDIAFTAFEVVERFAPLALGLAVVFKLRSLFGKKK